MTESIPRRRLNGANSRLEPTAFVQPQASAEGTQWPPLHKPQRLAEKIRLPRRRANLATGLCYASCQSLGPLTRNSSEACDGPATASFLLAGDAVKSARPQSRSYAAAMTT